MLQVLRKCVLVVFGLLFSLGCLAQSAAVSAKDSTSRRAPWALTQSAGSWTVGPSLSFAGGVPIHVHPARFQEKSWSDLLVIAGGRALMYGGKRKAGYSSIGTVGNDQFADAVAAPFILSAKSASLADTIVGLRVQGDSGVAPYIYPSDGSGHYLPGAPLTFPDGELSPDSLIVASDFDGDGFVDIGICDPDRQTFWLGRGDGQGAFVFSKLGNLPAGVASMAISHLGDSDVPVVTLKNSDGMSVVSGFSPGQTLSVQSLKNSFGTIFFDDLFGRGHSILGMVDADGLKVTDASVGNGQSVVVAQADTNGCSIKNAVPASVITSGRSLAEDLLVVSDCGQNQSVKLLENPSDVIVGTVLGDYQKLSPFGVSLGIVVHPVVGQNAPTGEVILGYEGKVFHKAPLDQGKATFKIQLRAGLNHLAVFYSGNADYAPYQANFTVRLPKLNPNAPQLQPQAQPGEELSLFHPKTPSRRAPFSAQFNGLVYDETAQDSVRFVLAANQLNGSFWLSNAQSTATCSPDLFDGIDLTSCTATAPTYPVTVYSNSKGYITFEDDSYDCGAEGGYCNQGYSVYGNTVIDNGASLGSASYTLDSQQGWCDDPYGDGTCVNGSGIEETQQQYQTGWGPNLGVGSHSIVISWTNGDSYSFSENVLPAISWNTPAPINLGTALSGTQLNATFNEAGSCSYNYSSGYVFSSPGNYTLTVTCNPSDTTDYATASASVTLTVQGKLTPSLSVSCSPNPITYGSQTTNCTSSLTGGSSPTGSETWTINGGAWTTTAINGSAGGFNGWSPGQYTIGVTYSGDGSNNSVYASTVLTINKATPSGYLSCSPNTITYGSQTSSCGPVVNAVSGGAAPSGSATVYWNGNLWGTFGLSGGSYSQSFGGQPAGGYTFTGTYNGDGNYNAVGLSAGGLTIQKTSTSLSIGCSGTAVYGSVNMNCSPSLSGAVSPGSAMSWGYSVNGAGCTVGSWASGYSPSSSVGNWSGFPAESITVCAQFVGDANNGASNIASTSFVIQKATPSISVAFGTQTVNYGQSTNVTVQVGCNSACGNVDYRLDGGEWGTVALNGSGGSTAPTGTTWAAGTHTIQVNYQGNSNYNAVSSSTYTFTILQLTPSVGVSCSPGTLKVGVQTTCTASVPTGDGVVYFYWPTALTGEWWNASYPSNGGPLSDAPVAISHDSYLNYDVAGTGTPAGWPNASPAPSGVNATTVYARWTGTFVSPVSGTYTIGVNSDDGANVYVNGTQLVANLSTGQGASSNLTYTQSGTISLSAGAVNTIVVEYEQGGGDAGIQLLWTIPGASGPTFLGWGAVAVNGSGQATISGVALATGSSTVTATWSGDQNYQSGSGSTTLNVTTGTAGEVSSNMNPSSSGQSVTFSGMLDTGGTLPTGNLAFDDSGNEISLESLSAVSTLNLIRDSNLQYGSALWALNSFPVVQGVGGSIGGNAFVYTGTGSAAGWQWNTSSVIPVTPGAAYTLSGYIDATAVTSGVPIWSVFSPDISTGYFQIGMNAGSAGRASGSFTIPAGVTQVVVICDTANVTVSNGGKLIWSEPQLEQSAQVGPYVLTDASPRAGFGGTATYSTSSLGAGTHPITSVFAGDAVDGASTSPALSQVVNKSTPTLSASCSPNPVTYGGTYTCTASVGSGATGTVTWPAVLGGETTTLSGGATSTSVRTATANAGPYSGTVTYNGDSNNYSTSTTASLTVAKAVITVTANNQSMTYAGAVPSLTASYSGFQNGDTTAVISGSPSLSTSATPTSPVGSYTINCGVGSLSATNYTFACVNGTLTIGAAALSITPNAQNKSYGSTLTIPATAFTSSGLKNSDTVSSVTLTSPGTAATAGAGSYTISGSNATGTGLGNYSITYNTGTLTVSKATLTVTANNASMSYGGAVPGFSPSYSGFQNSDTSAVLSGAPSLSTTANSGSPVGSYAITCGVGTLSAANYTFTCVNGTLTIGAAALSITPNAQNKSYGSALTIPGSAFTSSGLKNSDTVSSVTMTSPGIAATAAVGSYTISSSGASGTGLSNYSITYNTGTLTVGKAVLTVAANNASMIYQSTLPALTASFSGFENGDTASVLTGAPSLTTTATSNSAVGTYPISAGPGTLAATNYSFSFIAGLLTIAKGTPGIVLVSSANPSAYGSAVTFTASVPAGTTGSVTFIDGAVPLGTAPISGTVAMLATTGLSGGSHSITAQYNGDANNNPTTSSVLFQTVNAAPLTVTGASSLNPATFGDAVSFTFNFAGSGAVPTGTATISVDGTVVLTVALDASGNVTYATSSLAAGSHTIVATYNGNADYF